MIPLSLTRQSAPVEAMEVRKGGEFLAARWLRLSGYDVELHTRHGLLITTDAGPVSADYGQFVTVSATGRVEVWDRSELLAEHEGEIA